MVRYQSKLKKLLALIVISLFLISCEEGCVESYEFGVKYTIVDSNPTDEGIEGQYDDQVGGQVAGWHNSLLRTNGEQLKVLVRGTWTPWSTVSNDDDLAELPICTMCAKIDGFSNCICQDDEQPATEPDNDGSIPIETDCIDNIDDQTNPDKCTCTLRQNLPGDIIYNQNNIYYIALNYQDKNGDKLNPDRQKSCRYTQGFGLYAGLFGLDGNEDPVRKYQLYSTDSYCLLGALNAQGQCLDDDGNDVMQYLYISPCEKIWVKTDNSGDIITDSEVCDSPGQIDDEYHKAGEIIKLIIFDRFYDDNYGRYYLTFLGGVIAEQDEGLLEYIVGLFEDVVIGKRDDNGVRQGGAIEYLYNAIVKNSTFIIIVQLSLTLYIVFFGIGVLGGMVDVSRKDLMKRVMKISLVIFFTTATSWYWYNQIVVGFFKDGMDSIIGMIMNFGDQSFSTKTLIAISGISSGSLSDYATRFSYVDFVIEQLFSDAVTKKIWGLFFGVWFGILYIPIIYLLIAFFVYVMLTAALIYIVAMLKLVLTLALGPLFIITSLFSHTEDMFKKWLSFMAARAIEVISVFTVLYIFLGIIYEEFLKLLSVRVCLKPLSDWTWNVIYVYKTEADRSFMGWMLSFMVIGGLLFLLKMIMDKIPELASSLVSISGTGDAGGGSATSMVNNIMGGFRKVATTAVGRSLGYVTRGGVKALKLTGNATGLRSKWNKMGDKVGKGLGSIPIVGGMLSKGPRARMRDMTLNKEIFKCIEQAKAEGWEGTKLSQQVRKKVLHNVSGEKYKNKGKLLGINSKAIINRLDEKLLKEPLKKYLKKEAKILRQQGIYGDDARQKLKAGAKKKFADYDKDGRQIPVTLAVLEKYLSNLKNLTRVELKSYDAVKMIKEGKLDKNEYMHHLKARQAKMELDRRRSPLLSGMRDVKNQLTRNEKYNPKMMMENVSRGLKYEEDRKKGEQNRGQVAGYFTDKHNIINPGKDHSITHRIKYLDKFMSKKGRRPTSSHMDLKEEVAANMVEPAVKYLEEKVGGAAKDQKAVDSWYEKEKRDFHNNDSQYETKSEINKERDYKKELIKQQEVEYGEILGVSRRLEDIATQRGVELANQIDSDKDAKKKEAEEADRKEKERQKYVLKEKEWKEILEASDKEGKLESITKGLQSMSDGLCDSFEELGKGWSQLSGEGKYDGFRHLQFSYARLKGSLISKSKQLDDIMSKKTSELENLKKQDKDGNADKIKKLEGEIDVIQLGISDNQTELSKVESHLNILKLDNN